jgi:hypothetical protein
MSSDASKKNRFLMRYKEKSEHNQYWYSTPTIDAMVAATEEKAKKGAFLSTPSIFYSLTSEELRKNSTLFDVRHPPLFVTYDDLCRTVCTATSFYPVNLASGVLHVFPVANDPFCMCTVLCLPFPFSLTSLCVIFLTV